MITNISTMATALMVTARKAGKKYFIVQNGQWHECTEDVYNMIRRQT